MTDFEESIYQCIHYSKIICLQIAKNYNKNKMIGCYPKESGAFTRDIFPVEHLYFYRISALFIHLAMYDWNSALTTTSKLVSALDVSWGPYLENKLRSKYLLC